MSKTFICTLANSGKIVEVHADSEEDAKKHFEDKRVAVNYGNNQVASIREKGKD